MNWAVCLHPEDAATLAALRSHAGVLAAELDGRFWVQGTGWSAALDREVRKLPAVGRYEVLNDGGLRPMELRLPQGRLPAGEWKPLHELLKVTLPVAALPGDVSGKVPLTLVRSTAEKPATILLTDIEAWCDFAARAPEIRLSPLAFAMDDEGRVLVRGTPLPSMPGERFVEHQGIAVPAGWAWSPAVSSGVVRRLFGLTGNDLILWQRNGRTHRLHGEQFVAATRSAVRLSAAVMREAPDADT